MHWRWKPRPATQEPSLLMCLTNLLVLLVLRPPVCWPFFLNRDYVDKACFVQLLLVVERCIDGRAHSSKALVNEVRPLLEGAIVGKRVVVGHCRVNDVLDLDNAAGVEVAFAV